jgi:hypothetical protein
MPRLLDSITDACDYWMPAFAGMTMEGKSFGSGGLSASPDVESAPRPNPLPARAGRGSTLAFLLRRVQRFAERRIIGVALRVAAVEGRLVRHIERRAAL